MAVVSPPSGFDAAFFYSSYNSSLNASIKNELWETFVDVYFPAGGNGPYNDALNSGGTWPPADLTTYLDYKIIEGIFGATLKDFFYVYAFDNSIASSSVDSVSEARTQFTAYLNDVSRASSAKRQSTVLLWVWEVLVQILQRFHDAAPTKGGYALAMADAEKASVDLLTEVSFGTQSSSSDYGTQRNNMQAQQDAELYRSYRAIVGKRGQDAQAMITTTRDTASNHSQLMASVLQAMESMIQAVIKR